MKDPAGPFDLHRDEESDCCVGCHLSWEESYVLGYLPQPAQQRIVREHEALRAYRRRMSGWPRQQLLRHAEWEDAVFARYLPEAVLARMKHEHRVLDFKIRQGLPLDD